MLSASRIFPNWEQIRQFRNPLTSGESELLRFLDENLPRDPDWKEEEKLENYNGWLIFVQPFMNGNRPDIVLFNPYIGMQIIEVKDWNLNNYSWEGKQGEKIFCVSDSKGTYPLKSPVKQVEHYKENLISYLVPQIGEKIDQNERLYGLIKISVYFHNATTSQSRGLFNDEKYKVTPIFGRDYLDKSQLKRIVPDSELKSSYYWDQAWNKEILFWLYPPSHSIEQGKPIELTPKQMEAAEPEPGHFRVRGIAGSGKTQVLAYRSGKLASQGKKVLILSFNITLWHYIRDMVQRTPFNFRWDSIAFNHFHGFCKDVLNRFGKDWPKVDDESVFISVVPNMVLDLIEGNEFEKYDSILIDEGQDYCYEWYNMLCHFLNNRDECVVVCDKKQNIYGRNLDWLDKRKRDRNLDKFGKWIDLRRNIRLSPGIARIANEFSEIFKLNQEIKSEDDGNPVLFNIEHIVWWNINESEWLNMINKSFNLMKEKVKGLHPLDLVILLPNRIFGFNCVKFFQDEKKINVNHVFEDDEEKKYHPKKKAFWMGDSRLKISTIHSFKGWEINNVILFISGNSGIMNSNHLDSLVYTAITRTRQNIIVINANNRYREFGKRLPIIWQ